jgi:glycosyltransferase involved in cell wall biosynthesis
LRYFERFAIGRASSKVAPGINVNQSASADISLLVAAYNVAPYIARCLNSLTRQTLVSIEIIVVDDGSTDGTSAIIDVFAQRDPRIVVVRHAENRGVLAARKSAVERATGQFIMFVDGDDSMPPDGCAIALDGINRAKTDIVAFPPCVVAEPPTTEEQAEGVRNWIKHGRGIIYGSAIIEQCFIKQDYRPNVWSKIYKSINVKSAFKNINKDLYVNIAEDYYILHYSS